MYTLVDLVFGYGKKKFIVLEKCELNCDSGGKFNFVFTNPKILDPSRMQDLVLTSSTSRNNFQRLCTKVRVFTTHCYF
jgi:hypothetical protein